MAKKLFMYDKIGVEAFKKECEINPLPTLVPWSTPDAKEIHIDVYDRNLSEMIGSVILYGEQENQNYGYNYHYWKAYRIWKGNLSLKGIGEEAHGARLYEFVKRITLNIFYDMWYERNHANQDTGFRWDTMVSRVLDVKTPLIAHILFGTMWQYERLHMGWIGDLRRAFYSDYGAGKHDGFYLDLRVVELCKLDEYLRNDLIKYRWARAIMRDALEKCNSGSTLGDVKLKYQDLKDFLFNNKTVRRSLYNMPGGIPFGIGAIDLIEDLLKFDLDFRSPLPRDPVLWVMLRAVIDKIEFHGGWPDEGDSYNITPAQMFYDMLRRTPLNRIRDIMRQECPNGLRKKVEIMQVARNIFDIPMDIVDVGKVQFPALVEASKVWHREQQRMRAKTVIEQNLPTKAPPIPLPSDERFRFLDSIQAMYTEGDEMGHCVGWNHYHEGVAGSHYFFAYEDERGRATLMIEARTGVLVQCFGPNNTITVSSKSAEKAIRKWTRKLKEHRKNTEIQSMVEDEWGEPIEVIDYVDIEEYIPF